jgi:hypothetical protein
VIASRYKAVFSSLFDASPPESELKTEDIFAFDDRVVCRFRSVQKHAKDLFGVSAATNRVIALI